MSTKQERFPKRELLIHGKALDIFTEKSDKGNEGTHDLKPHPDKSRARACLRLRTQKPKEGHVSFSLDVPEESTSHRQIFSTIRIQNPHREIIYSDIFRIAILVRSIPQLIEQLFPCYR